ncbi:MAG: response regulator [Anaerolineales bacterium]
MILVVDDDEGARTTYEHWLKGEGLDVRSVEDGRAALNVLENTPTATVLLDLFMPGMEGIETLRAIKRDHPGSRVVVMSGLRYAGSDMLKAAMALGADGALEKPFSLNQLLGIIHGMPLPAQAGAVVAPL